MNAKHQASEPNAGTRRPEPREPLSEASKRAAKAATEAAVGTSRRFVAATPGVVVKAARILEDELALGLGAVRRIEQRFLDVDKLRAESPDAVMSRFRRDGHEAVDIILDVLTAAAQTVEAQAGRFVNVTAGARTSDEAADEGAGLQVTAVRVPGRVAAGESGEVELSLDNASDVATTGFTLYSSDLLGASGAKIPSSSVVFSPQTLSVGPKQAGRVAVRVTVPSGTPTGAYEGLVRATKLQGLRAMLIVVVA